ncbi:hypothetical protein [Paludisphaera borealis]|nr:hypothetical protein [Paludisphaera borealis]
MMIESRTGGKEVVRRFPSNVLISHHERDRKDFQQQRNEEIRVG